MFLTVPLIMNHHWHDAIKQQAIIWANEWVREWLSLTAFLGTADIEVHMVIWANEDYSI